MRGYFGKSGTYVITDNSMESPWEYIYQNGDILLRVDQNGPVNAQLKPPQDIFLFKRELSEKYSKWLTYIKCDGRIYSNFGYPEFSKAAKPEVKITFAPESAEYQYRYNDLQIVTQLIIPKKGAQIIMRTTVKNLSDKQQSYEVTPAVLPYINNALLAPWDKYEWYLRTGYTANDKYSLFFTMLNNPNGSRQGRRAAALYLDSGFGGSAEIALDKFTGAGDFWRPDALSQKALRLKDGSYGGFGAFGEENSVSGYAPVYAKRHNAVLNPGEEWGFSQVMSELALTQDGELKEEESYSCAYRLLDCHAQQDELNKSKEFFTGLFAKNTVKTANSEFDTFVNSFLPLQMHWVAALDRGWPTGMRGVRDASNDFMGLVMLESNKPREVLLQLFSCQRSDGWLPRQVSIEGKHGKHDLRDYVDGGVFACEFLYEYLCHTKDFGVLAERIPYLDKEEETSVAVHFTEALGYYLNKENIGEHGLCKIREGDWLDAVNRAGVLGRGESVMVTCQTVMALKYAIEILPYAQNIISDTKTLIDNYQHRAEDFARALESAYNGLGYYSSVFNDGGKWLFSDGDPDGVSRLYGPANYYAVISGIAAQDRAKGILEKCLNKLKTDMGYKLFLPAFGEQNIPNTGRIASGDLTAGLWENGNVYNHGSQGFLCRALSVMGMGEEVYDVLQYMMPYDQSRHPVELTKSAPYAVVNCYQDLPLYRHKGGMPFLTGTIAMIMRGIYNWMFGLCPMLDGLCIDPCLPKELKGAELVYNYNGKSIKVKYIAANKGQELTVSLDNKSVLTTKADCITGKSKVFIPDGDLEQNSQVIIAC